MSGLPGRNAEEFGRVRSVLEGRGHLVFSPPHDIPGTTDYRLALSANLLFICEDADGMVSLRGWGRSRGATAERRVAEAIGLPIWEWVKKDQAAYLCSRPTREVQEKL